MFSYLNFLQVPQLGEWPEWKKLISDKMKKSQQEAVGEGNASYEKRYSFVRAVLNQLMLRRTKTTRDMEGRLILTLPAKHLFVEKIPFTAVEADLYKAYFKKQKEAFEELLEIAKQ